MAGQGGAPPVFPGNPCKWCALRMAGGAGMRAQHTTCDSLLNPTLRHPSHAHCAPTSQFS